MSPFGKEQELSASHEPFVGMKLKEGVPLSEATLIEVN